MKNRWKIIERGFWIVLITGAVIMGVIIIVMLGGV